MSSEASAADAGRRTTVFLSYARADRARAEKLAAALSDAGLEVWWDALIEGGAAFAHSIRTELDTADVVIVAWSATSINSDWVRDEAAVGRERRRLVPLSLDGSEAPLGFRQYHVIDVSRWRGGAGAEEIAAIVRAVTTATGQPATTVPERRASVSRRGALWIGSGVVAALAGGGVLAWRTGLGGGGTVGAGIVVLPFKNLGGDPGQAHLAEGLTEEVRAALARNEALKVVAATSSNAVHTETEDATAIAHKLGVAWLLEGSVQRSDDIVRISTNLTDGATGFSRWSNTVDRNLSDIFAVQTEIAGTVAEALSVRLATDTPAPGGTTSVAAYEAYLKGRALFNAARDEASDREALANYDLAISTDGNFALAHAARSRSLAALAAEHAEASDLPGLYEEAISAARRVIAIAPDMAEGHSALGYALFTGKLDVAGARPAYDRAHALGRGDADILLLFALYCARGGRPAEAQAAITRALALDPLNPRTFRAAGSIDYSARRYEPGIAVLEKALALNPEISHAHGLIGNCLYFLDRTGEARAAYAAEPHDLFRLPGLAIADHRLGDIAAAKRSMAQLVEDLGDSALYQQAEVLAQWGEADAALAALERARAVGDSGLIYLSTDPMLDPLRRRPEFVRLLKELNFL
ncbi:TIR domain-containing protein [Roseibacterium beibuensis]|uniref:TIR domain-containing protein n=1 Tax=[Roseibacterium] beibuensis TaxID=1193142 RepID=UPI00217E74E2|nr:TIR domain-containing protein [Roseibacterium beibuensis]MCS6625436.1 TIR domain-containing protein [Roseibacterium beibuensis]